MYYNSKKEIQPDINVIYKKIHGIELPMSIYLPDKFDNKKNIRQLLQFMVELGMPSPIIHQNGMVVLCVIMQYIMQKRDLFQ